MNTTPTLAELLTICTAASSVVAERTDSTIAAADILAAAAIEATGIAADNPGAYYPNTQPDGTVTVGNSAMIWAEDGCSCRWAPVIRVADDGLVTLEDGEHILRVIKNPAILAPLAEWKRTASALNDAYREAIRAADAWNQSAKLIPGNTETLKVGPGGDLLMSYSRGTLQ